MKTHVHASMVLESYSILPSSLKAFFNNKLNGHRIIDIIANGAYLEDTLAGPLAGNRGALKPWLQHFWQKNLGETGLHYPKLQTLINIASLGLAKEDLVNNKAAYRRAEDYWQEYVINKWLNGSSESKEEALLNLGRVVHLLQDMATPAHTNNDMHIGGFWDDDDFEDYVGSECEGGIPYKYKAPTTLNPFYELDWDIKDLFVHKASETIKYDSDDENGIGKGLPYRHPFFTTETTNGQNFFRDLPMYDLTDGGCDLIAKNLMPHSYRFVASLLIHFMRKVNAGTHGVAQNLLSNKYKVSFTVDSLKVKNSQDTAGNSEVFIRSVNGAKRLRIPTKKKAAEQLGVSPDDIDTVYYSLDDNDSTTVDQALADRTLTKDETATIYMEVFDIDVTLDEVIDKVNFVVKFDDYKAILDTDKTTTLTYESQYSKVTLKISAETIPNAGNTTIIEETEPLKFYSAQAIGLSRELSNSSMFSSFFGKDDIRIRNFGHLNEQTILCSHDLMDLVEEDFFSSNDEVQDFKYEEWKQWINKPNNRVPISIDGVDKNHYVKFKITDLVTPTVPVNNLQSNYGVNIILHSIETPLEDGKVHAQIIKKLASKIAHLNVSKHLKLSVPYQNKQNIDHINIDISPSQWTCWVNDINAVHTVNVNGVKYHFVFEFTALEPNYGYTVIFRRIKVKNDGDPDYFYITDKGEIRGSYQDNGIMRLPNFKIGSIGKGSSKTLNKQLGESNNGITTEDSINFKVKVWDEDWPTKNDSLGTVSLNIPSSKWKSWCGLEDGYTTDYIKSSNGDVRISFIIKVKEISLFEDDEQELKTKSLNISSKKSTAINLNEVIAEMPAYVAMPPEHKTIDKSFEYWYSDLDNSLILHKEHCYHMNRVKKGNIKKVLLSKKSWDRIQNIENIDLLHLDNAHKVIERNIKKLKTSKLKTSGSIGAYKTGKDPKVKLKELKLSYKADRLREFSKSQDSKVKDELFKLYKLLHNARTCKHCMKRDNLK